MLSKSYEEILSKDIPTKENNISDLIEIISSSEKETLSWDFVLKNSRFVLSTILKYVSSSKINDEIFTEGLIAFKEAVERLKNTNYQNYCKKYIKWKVIDKISQNQTQLSKGTRPYRNPTIEMSFDQDFEDNISLSERINDPLEENNEIAVKNSNNGFLSGILIKIKEESNKQKRFCNRLTDRQIDIIEKIIKNKGDNKKTYTEAKITKSVFYQHKKNIKIKLNGLISKFPDEIKTETYKILGLIK